jgi:hypothetical protein
MSLFTINTSVADVYREPDFNSTMVTQALLGESCEILNQHKNWLLIRQWDGYEGWVNHFFGVHSEEPYMSSHVCYSLSTPLLDEPDGEIFRKICFNCSLKAESTENGYRVILPDGMNAWTNIELYSSPDPATRENILQSAFRFLGTPYQWGGKTPGGMDCSGFVQTVFKSAGVNLPRDAHQQEESLKNAQVELEEAGWGDLLFFSENGRVTHVAICTGEMEFINARGWVRKESLEENAHNFNKNLKSLFSSAVSMKDLLIV